MPLMATERKLGDEVDFTSADRPRRTPLRGAYVMLRPVVAGEDAGPLYAESHPPLADPGHWTYMPGGPYRDAADLRDALAAAETSEDPLFFTLATLPDERPVGIASYLRITPEHGVIEIGYIWFGASLRRTTAASEAIPIDGSQSRRDTCPWRSAPGENSTTLGAMASDSSITLGLTPASTSR